MKRLLPFFAVVSTVVTALSPTAEAAPWQSINQRQAVLEERINQGIQVGTLTRAEAISLRGEFRAIANLEAEYRRSGDILTERERLDLDRRFTALSQRIRAQKSDFQARGEKRWTPISEQKARIFTQIENGVSKGALTRAEAGQLRSDFGSLLALEAEYRRSGGDLSMNERADLQRRLDHLLLRVKAERRDLDRRY